MASARLAVLRLPAWTRAKHPIVRDEMRRWKRFSGRGGWLALLAACLLLLALPGVCVLGLSLSPTSSGTENISPAGWIGLLGGTLALTAAALSSLMGWLLNLLATLLGASLIAREREQQRWPFLHLTALTTTEIVGGKLASLLRLLARPMHLAAGLRLFAIGIGLATLAWLAAASGVSAAQVINVLGVAREVLSATPLGLLLAGSVGVLEVLAIAAYWVIQPYTDGLYNSVIGLTASTLVRSRGLAIGAAFVLHFALGLAIYTPAQQAAFVISTLLLSQSAATAGLGALGGFALASVQFGVGLALQVAVLIACLFFVVQRLEKLGD